MATEKNANGSDHVVRGEHRYFTLAIEKVLRRTPVAQWSAYALLMNSEDGTARLMQRGELAAWLRVNDLPDLAKEASNRKVPRGGLLVLSLASDGPFFRVLFAPQRKRRHDPEPEPQGDHRPGVPTGGKRTAP